MSSQYNRETPVKSSLVRSLRSSSLVRFGAMSLALLGALFWARQKLISPTPRMAIADPPHVVEVQAEPQPEPQPQGVPTAAAGER